MISKSIITNIKRVEQCSKNQTVKNTLYACRQTGWLWLIFIHRNCNSLIQLGFEHVSASICSLLLCWAETWKEWIWAEPIIASVTWLGPYFSWALGHSYGHLHGQFDFILNDTKCSFHPAKFRKFFQKGYQKGGDFHK